MALRWAWHNLDRPVGAGIAGPIGVTTVMANPQAAQLTHAFVRGSDGNLWLNRRVPIGWEWVNQGQPTSSVSVQGPVGVTTVKDYPDAAQRPYAFVVGSDGNLWINWWAYNHWEWSNQGQPPGLPSIAEGVGAATVMHGPQASQLPAAFVRGTDNNLWSHSWDGAQWTWFNHGNPPGLVTVTGPVGVTTAMDTAQSAQRVHVFVRGSDDHLWLNRWAYDHWEWSKQSPPLALPDLRLDASIGVISVMDTPQSAQHPYAFVRGNDGWVWMNWWDGSHWHWSPLGSPPGVAVAFGIGATTVKDFPDAAQRPYAFICGSDAKVWLDWWAYDHFEWSNQGWPIGYGDPVAPLGAVTVMDDPNTSQRPQAFVLSADGDLWLLRWG